MTRMVFFNIGWMDHYLGLTAQDPIESGGSFVDKRAYGHEIYNFQPCQGRLYGYVRVTHGGAIKLERLGAFSRQDSVDDILVVWVARNPDGGTFVVGWYQHATVYRSPQDLPLDCCRILGAEPVRFRASANESDGVLLQADQRVLQLPRGKGGMGQSNVWYARENAHFQVQLLDFIENYCRPSRGRIAVY